MQWGPRPPDRPGADRRGHVHEPGERDARGDHDDREDQEHVGDEAAVVARVHGEHGRQEAREARAALGRNPDRQAGHQRECRQHGERQRHHRGRLVDVVRRLLGHARRAEEGEEKEAEGVERGEERAQQEDRPHHAVAVEGGREDLVLREEAGEERHAGEPRGADRHRDRRRHHARGEAAHLAEVLLAAHAVDDAACAEEEQRLEEGVRDEVENACGVRAEADRREHVAELAHGRVREHALDVGLHEADRGGEDRRRSADPRDDLQRRPRALEERVAPRHHVDASRHHRRRVDERGDRGRALHRVGQPRVERELRRLPARAHEEEERDARRRRGRERLDALEHRLVIQRAERAPEPHDAETEPEVADAVDDERLLPRLRRRRARVPEADEEVRAEAHRLPEHVEQEEVAGEHQHGHGENEQVQVGKIAGVAGIVVHVAGGVEVDQRADAGDDEQHHGGELVHVRHDGGLEVARHDPREERAGEAPPVPDAREDRARREKRAGERRHRDPVGPPTDEVAEEDVDDRARERKSRDQPESGHRAMLARGRWGCQGNSAWYHPPRAS